MTTPACTNCALIGHTVPAAWRYDYANPNWPGMGFALCDPCRIDQQYLEAWQAPDPWHRPEWHVYTRLGGGDAPVTDGPDVTPATSTTTTQ